jgi:uncharacterized YigZ family protein
MRIPSGEARAEIEIKKSKFIAIAGTASDREEAKAAVSRQWERHPEASHIVWAFQAGERGDIFGMSDDGEPKQTAGRPVLEVIKGSGISDLLIMVIRYFGGTKLGTGGLVKAYTEAARAVLALLPTEERVLRLPFSLTIHYSHYQRGKELLEEAGAAIDEESFAGEVTIRGTLPSPAVEDLDRRIADLSSGNTRLEITGGEHYGRG